MKDFTVNTPCYSIGVPALVDRWMDLERRMAQDGTYYTEMTAMRVQLQQATGLVVDPVHAMDMAEAKRWKDRYQTLPFHQGSQSDQLATLIGGIMERLARLESRLSDLQNNPVVNPNQSP